MATAKRSKADYIFQRPGSANWYIKLRSGGQRIEKSLGTPHKHEAEIIALRGFTLDDGTTVSVSAHKTRLLAARPRLATAWEPQYQPGLRTGPNGERIFATERELHFLDAEGDAIRTEPNGGPAYQMIGVERRLGLTVPGLVPASGSERPTVPTKNSDDALFQTYLDHGGRNNRGIHGYSRREAVTVWALYKQLTNNKLLKHATRDDGRKLVAHFQSEGAEPPTIQKKIGWLVYAVNFAIKEGGSLTLNPFSGIAPKRTMEEKKEARRQSLSNDDIKRCKRNLSKLGKSDQLLFRLLATTGMRLGEPFQIRGELQERGIRYVEVGTKTEQSWRRVPLPAGLLPYLPKVIKGSLFEGTEKAASKRLNRFLREIGITDPHKVAYSLRHRAKDRLREYDVADKLAEAIFGRDEKSVGDDYGKGYSVAKLKKWIDRIGF
jgi:integrase